MEIGPQDIKPYTEAIDNVDKTTTAYLDQHQKVIKMDIWKELPILQKEIEAAEKALEAVQSRIKRIEPYEQMLGQNKLNMENSQKTFIESIIEMQDSLDKRLEYNNQRIASLNESKKR